jgi:hypothetical protein
MADCTRGEDQHFEGTCTVCGQKCQCQLRVVAVELTWRSHQYGSGESGYLQFLPMFTLSWRIGTQGDPPMERPWRLTTTLPLKKSVTEKWDFTTREAAKDMAWRAASAWLQRATEVK